MKIIFQFWLNFFIFYLTVNKWTGIFFIQWTLYTSCLSLYVPTLTEHNVKIQIKIYSKIQKPRRYTHLAHFACNGCTQREFSVCRLCMCAYMWIHISRWLKPWGLLLHLVRAIEILHVSELMQVNAVRWDIEIAVKMFSVTRNFSWIHCIIKL